MLDKFLETEISISFAAHNNSGSGAARQRTCMGCKGSQVRILSSRRKREHQEIGAFLLLLGFIYLRGENMH